MVVAYTASMSPHEHTLLISIIVLILVLGIVVNHFLAAMWQLIQDDAAEVKRQVELQD